MSDSAVGQYRYAVHHSEEVGVKVRKTIWKVFWVLLIVTATELLLGMFWRDWNLNWYFVKTTFITLTIVKSYFIVAYFMHLKDERSSFNYTLLIPYCAFALYLIILCVNEGSAIFSTDMLLRW